MRTFWIVLLLGTLAWSQAPPATVKSPAHQHAVSAEADDEDDKKPEPLAGSNVAETSAVLTIHGLCPTAPGGPTAHVSSRTACKTIVTREQFEKLVMAIMPAMSPQSKRQFASSYPHMLAMAHEAQSRGIEKSARYQQIVAFAKIQILSQELIRELKEEAAKVPQKDVENHYRQNLASFEQASVERLFVPLRKQAPASGSANPDDAKAHSKAAEEAMSKEAQELRARAAAGEDFSRLQQEAYDAAGIKASASSAMTQTLRRSQLPAAHASVFELKPDEVSEVISDTGGHYIYKLNSTRLEPLEEARAEIQNILSQQRLHEMMEKIDHSFITEENQAYFGAATKPEAEDRD